MNNWRLLLLAVIAVFQPIASFTDRNLIDGRQQCCDRLSSAPLQDTRSSLHGTYRIGKSTPALRHLNDRDEVREDRRYELRQRVSFSRFSTERPLVDVRAGVARHGSSEIARSPRVERVLERPANSPSRDSLLEVNQREESARSVRNLNPQALTRGIVERTSADALERRNARAYTESPRAANLFRDNYSTERFGNERFSKNMFDSQREMHRELIRSADRKITLYRDAQRVLSRTKDDVPSSDASKNVNTRQVIARQRLTLVRRESSMRPDTRRYTEHEGRRDMQRNNEQRRSLTDNTRLVDRIRGMRVRLNAREDNRENRRIRINQRLPTENFDERREQREERRESRQHNKENIDSSTSDERMQLARNMNTQNKRNVGDRRELRHNERMSRERIQDEIRENLDHILSRERILSDRRNNRESRIINVQNKREVDDRQDISYNKRMTRETRDENRKNFEQRLSRERVQIDRRNIRESRIMNTQNTKDVDGRREIIQHERMTREEIRDNEQRISREVIQMDRRNIRESRITHAKNKRDVADRREIRNKETRNENRFNLEQRLSRERIQMDRENVHESRIINSRIKRKFDSRSEMRQNERLSGEARGENRVNLEQRLSHEKIQMNQGNIRESRIMDAQNRRNVADRRDIRHNDMMTSNTREERENHFNEFSVERTQIKPSNIRELRMINNMNTRDDTRRIDSMRDTRFNTRISRETHKLSLERVQMEGRNIREFRTFNTEIDSRQEIRYKERSTEVRKEARVNPEQRISLSRIQMDRRNVREFRNINNVIRNERDTESRREIRTDTRLQTENREIPGQRLSRERIQMDHKNIRESKIRDTLQEKDLDRRQEIKNNERPTKESGEESRGKLDRRLARESRQVDRRNTREARLDRATRNERSIETNIERQREIRYNERLSGQNHGNQFTRERQDITEDRYSLLMDRRARSADRRNFREMRSEPRLSRSSDSERRTEAFHGRIENREREARDARSRNVEMTRNRERLSSVMVGEMGPENDFTVANWQYVLYTLQAAYLCALFMQMLTPSRTEKAHKMNLRWLPVSSHYNPIKVD